MTYAELHTMLRLLPGRVALLVTILASTVTRADELSPTTIANQIDRRLGLANNSDCRFASDAEFLRRLTLDLAGRIPTIAEVHEYLGNSSESRSGEAIDRLMNSGVYYRNMATFWRRSWVPQADTPEFASVADGFEQWLAHRLQQGARYDEMVVEVLTLNSATVVPASTSPIGFYDANLAKSENLAASSTRAFLGINLDCAQCHDHPFARWTREQFWQTAAFFALPNAEGDGDMRLPTVRIPDTELEYQPALLTRAEITWPSQIDSVSLRFILVDWMKRDDQRLMAKNAVNRLWAHYFGEAIVEPMDDLSRDEFATGARADLLNDLATAFIACDYDQDVIVKGIVGSRAYRLASSPQPVDDSPAGETPGEGADSPESAATASSETAPLRISSASIRGLTGEQLYDSLQTAAGLPSERTDVGGRSGRNLRRDFTSTFYIERSHNAERSIAQALTLMNGSFVNDLASSKGNPMLASLLNSPFMTFDTQIDTVFIAVLGRHANPDELQAVKQRFESRPEVSHEKHLGNLFWALVNTSEFNTNH